jgi:hypothetical protein
MTHDHGSEKKKERGKGTIWVNGIKSCPRT